MTIPDFARSRRLSRSMAASVAAILVVSALTLPNAAPTFGSSPGVDVQLPLGQRISGRVTGPGGVSVAGASVFASDLAGHFAQGTTGPDGTYVLHALADGTYHLNVDAPRPSDLVGRWYGAPTSDTDGIGATDIVIAGASATAIDVELEAKPYLGIGIGGTIRDPDGLPVPGVRVAVNGDAGGGQATSGTDGDFHVDGLGPGFYTLTIEPPDGSDYPAGPLVDGVVGAQGTDGTPIDVGSTDVTGIDVTLVRGARISGHVSTARPAVIQVSADGDSGSGRATVDPNGDFVIRGLPSGSYRIVFREALAGPELTEAGTFPYGAYGPGGKLVSQDAALLVEVTGADISLDPVAIPRGTDIVGTVLDGRSGLANAYLMVCDVQGILGCATDAGAADGSFRIKHVPTGAFSIFVSVPGRVAGYYLENGGFTIDTEGAGPVRVVSGGPDTRGVMVVVPAGGSVLGKVTGPDGQPVAGARVQAHPLGIPPNFALTVSGADGRYRETGIPNGLYGIAVDGPAGSDYLSGYYLTGAPGGFTTDQSTATRFRVIEDHDRTAPFVTVREPGPGAVDVAIDSTVSIRFSEPVSGVDGKSVQLRDPRGKALAASVTFDDQTRTATLVPNAPIEPGTRYRIVIGSTIRDWSGNPFGGASWSFQTAP